MPKRKQAKPRRRVEFSGDEFETPKKQIFKVRFIDSVIKYNYRGEYIKPPKYTIDLICDEKMT